VTPLPGLATPLPGLVTPLPGLVTPLPRVPPALSLPALPLTPLLALPLPTVTPLAPEPPIDPLVAAPLAPLAVFAAPKVSPDVGPPPSSLMSDAVLNVTSGKVQAMTDATAAIATTERHRAAFGRFARDFRMRTQRPPGGNAYAEPHNRVRLGHVRSNPSERRTKVCGEHALEWLTAPPAGESACPIRPLGSEVAASRTGN
jgi:hypothetical protein